MCVHACSRVSVCCVLLAASNTQAHIPLGLEWGFIQGHLDSFLLYVSRDLAEL